VGARTTYRLLPVESAGFHEGREKIIYQVESEEQLTQLLVFKHMHPRPRRLVAFSVGFYICACTSEAAPKLKGGHGFLNERSSIVCWHAIALCQPRPDEIDITQVHKHHNQDDAIHIVSTELLSNAAATAGALPSLEFTAITLALHACSQISLYGFFAAERQGARFHYYDLAPSPPSPVSQASNNMNAGYRYRCATACESR
jgi:hypothetical protein